MLQALLQYILTPLLVVCVVTAIILWHVFLILKLRLRSFKQNSTLAKALTDKQTVGFFHPYCAAGGGGERVLWCAIHSVQKHHPELHCVVYTGDQKTKEEMLDGSASKFGVKLRQDSVHFVFLNGRKWVEADTWPRFTLLGQSLGSILLGWEAVCEFCPDIMIDSMGYAFTFPIFKLLGSCRLGCYVHYPTISTDMLARVQTRELGVCNDSMVARSAVLSQVKIMYYRIFAFVYGIVGRFAEAVMVNSTWTRGHIDALWRISSRTATVFPPCDTSALNALPLKRDQMSNASGHLVLSLAQFRPEKDHSKQLTAFAAFLKKAPQHRTAPNRVRLLMAGGCRDDGDWQRFRALETLAVELGLSLGKSPESMEDWDVALQANLSIAEVHKFLGTAAVGLHTMREEHFGISVVEFMAAGAVVLAHDSGGPRMDIVTSPDGACVGYLASDADSYADCLCKIFALSADERLEIGKAARTSIGQRFSQEVFEDEFSNRMIAQLRR